MSEVSFPGEPPFYLPTAQNASATALGETVELTLRVVAPGHGPGPQAVQRPELLFAIGGGTPKFSASELSLHDSLHPFAEISNRARQRSTWVYTEFVDALPFSTFDVGKTEVSMYVHFRHFLKRLLPMIKRRRGAQKSRRPKAICDKLDGAALNRIIQAAGNAPDDLNREELRSALENVPSWYATHQSLRVSAKRKRAGLNKILNAAERLKTLLSGDAWLLILNRLSISDPDPRHALTWLTRAASDILNESSERLPKLVEDFKTTSTLEDIAGIHLPVIFEQHLHRSRGRSRNPDGTPTGPCVRFVYQAMTELGMPYDKESIARAISRAKPGSAPRKKYIGRKQEKLSSFAQ
jgi:hypothetical protein